MRLQCCTGSMYKLDVHPMKIKRALSLDKALFALMGMSWQGVGDVAESITNLWTNQTHNSNHNDRHEYHDERILDEALAFFFRCK